MELIDSPLREFKIEPLTPTTGRKTAHSYPGYGNGYISLWKESQGIFAEMFDLWEQYQKQARQYQYDGNEQEHGFFFRTAEW